MVIYKITNTLNNKVYIGQTKQKVSVRFSQHRYNLRKNTHCNKHLQRAWNFYSESSFTFILIEQFSKESGVNLNEIETEWITKLKSNMPENGYNLTSGGLVCEFSEEARKNMSEAQKRFYQTEIGKKRLEELSSYAKGRSPWNKGIKGIGTCWNKGISTGPQPEDVLIKRSKSMLGKNIGKNNGQFGKIAPNAKVIYCHQTNETFNSAREASVKFNIPSRSIRRVASCVRSSIYGFTFEYINKKQESK